MTNFDDMSLEELQQLLRVNTKNPDQVKRIQEMSGLTGKAVDGIWGKQTSKAWNNFLDENQNTIEQAIQDEQNFQNAMSRGQTSPAVVDVVGFANQLDEQQQARNLKIAKLEEQIAQVEERIARNKRALTGKSYEDVNNKLAQLEMDKIGFRFNGQSKNNDPTSFWRWNIARQDTKEANNQRNTEAKNKFANEIYKWEHREFDPKMKAEEVRQEVRNIESAIQEGKNIDADVSPLEKVRQKLLDRLNGKGNTAIEEWNNTFDAFMTGVKNGKYTKAEIDEFRKNNANSLSGAQDNTLLDASLKAGKAEIAKANSALEEKAKELFKKERPSEDWDDVSENTKKKFRDLARGK